MLSLCICVHSNGKTFRPSVKQVATEGYLKNDSTIKLLPETPTLPIQENKSMPVSLNVETFLKSLPVGIKESITSLINLKNSNFRYVAIGGSLTAGFRNGGLYRQAQLTSFPNLLSRQMGIENFRQPLFDINQGNGSGYKILLQNSSSPAYGKVNNNTAIPVEYPLTLSRYSGRVDNFGLPGMGPRLVNATDKWGLDLNPSIGLTYEVSYRAYLRRLLPDNDQQWSTTYYSLLVDQILESSDKVSFITIELGLDDVIWYTTKGGYRLGAMIGDLSLSEGNTFTQLFTQMKDKNIKGVVSTIPDVLSFPYFSLYTVKALKGNLKFNDLYAIADDGYNADQGNPKVVRKVNDDETILPSDRVYLLAQGKSKQGLTVDNPLLSLDILDRNEKQALFRVDELNGLIRTQAKAYDIPVFDLKSLYEQILSGNYVTDDGIKVDPSFPYGNFFSADGLYPTAFGQAVITNEWIKTINNAYFTRIPLISTRLFTKDL